MVIWPYANSAQNSMAAVSAEGSMVCVLIRRLNSFSISAPFVSSSSVLLDCLILVVLQRIRSAC